jgi:hypothetical protein
MAKLSDITIRLDRKASESFDERTSLVAIKCTSFECLNNLRDKGHCNLKRIHVEQGRCQNYHTTGDSDNVRLQCR